MREATLVLTYVWIALGSALGGMARFAGSLLIAQWLGQGFPFGTLTINVVGCFIIGFFAALTAPGGPVIVPADVRRFVMVGLCGGFTTFSAFSLETLTLWNSRAFGRAGLNIGASVGLCLLSVWLGWTLARVLGGAAAR